MHRMEKKRANFLSLFFIFQLFRLAANVTKINLCQFIRQEEKLRTFNANQFRHFNLLLYEVRIERFKSWRVSWNLSNVISLTRCSCWDFNFSCSLPCSLRLEADSYGLSVERKWMEWKFENTEIANVRQSASVRKPLLREDELTHTWRDHK